MEEIIKTLQKLADMAEVKGVKIFYTAIARQYRDVAKYVLQYGIDATLRDLDRIIKREDMTAAMLKYYEVAVIPMAIYQYRLLREGEKSFGSDLKLAIKTWLQQVSEFIYTRGSTKITYIDETTRNNIRESLNQAKTEGLGARSAAKRVADQNEKITPKRALLIARTEGTRAASEGSKMASDKWKKETGKQRWKKWVSIIDKRTRFDHVEADGQIVPDEQNFEVGVNAMEFPGAEGAPADEVCNCRCRVLYMSQRMMERLSQAA